MPGPLRRLPPGLPPLREVIAQYALDARKSLGQHFLLDPVLIARIAALAGDLSGRHVIEVGPGPGGLTRALLETHAESVTAIEVDTRAAAAIEALRLALDGHGDASPASPQELGNAPPPSPDGTDDARQPSMDPGAPGRFPQATDDTSGLAPEGERDVPPSSRQEPGGGSLGPAGAIRLPRLRVIEADALRQDLAALVPAPRQIVANLPYNIGTPLLIGWLRQAASWERLTLMFQMEVAERIAAAPDSDAYGRLAVLAQWTCRADLLMRIPPGAFLPPPKVFSAVVGLVPHAIQPDKALFVSMERLTAAAFGQRRKMLRGSLKSLGGEKLLDRADIDPQRRAETLSVAEFDRLARLL